MAYVPLYKQGGHTFGKVGPTQPSRRGQPVRQTDVRFFQERGPHLKNMEKVVGTTSAPSSDHRLTGFTPDGYAIWEKQATPTPPPAPAPAPAAPASSSPQQLQITAEAKKYREESEAKLAEAQTLLDNFKIEQNKAAEAKKLQEQMAIRAQGALASNLATSQRKPSLQLSPASQTPQTAGTQPFKRRRLQVMTPGSQVTSGLNIGSANLLNV